MYYCYGKKNFCRHSDECDGDCPFFNGEGGEDVNVPFCATRWWLFRFYLKQRLKSLWYKIRRK